MRVLMLDSCGVRQRMINACAMHLALVQNTGLAYSCKQKEILEGAQRLTQGIPPELLVSEWVFSCGSAEHSVYIGPAFDEDTNREILFNTDFSTPAYDYEAVWQELKTAEAYGSAAVLLVVSHAAWEQSAALLQCMEKRISPARSAVLLPDDNALLDRIFSRRSGSDRTRFHLPKALSYRDNSPVSLDEHAFVMNELGEDAAVDAICAALGGEASPCAWFYSSMLHPPQKGETLGVPAMEASYENALLWLLQGERNAVK